MSSASGSSGMELADLVGRANAALACAQLPYDVGVTAADAASVLRALDRPGAHCIRNLARDILVLRCSEDCLRDRTVFESRISEAFGGCAQNELAQVFHSRQKLGLQPFEVHRRSRRRAKKATKADKPCFLRAPDCEGLFFCSGPVSIVYDSSVVAIAPL